MIRNGNLSYADDLIKHHQILHNASCKGVGRNLVGACIAECSDAFVFQTVGLGKKGGHISGNSVCADTADYGCDSAACETGERGFRSSCVKATFSASAHNVLMAVD